MTFNSPSYGEYLKSTDYYENLNRNNHSQCSKSPCTSECQYNTAGFAPTARTDESSSTRFGPKTQTARLCSADDDTELKGQRDYSGSSLCIRYLSHCYYGLLQCLSNKSSYRNLTLSPPSGLMNIAPNSVSRIDRTSRLLFPLTFITFHVFYWIVYFGHRE